MDSAQNNPIWVYSQDDGACQSGMVFATNLPDASSFTLFKADAMKSHPLSVEQSA